jgi:hypothetical protein
VEKIENEIPTGLGWCGLIQGGIDRGLTRFHHLVSPWSATIISKSRHTIQTGTLSTPSWSPYLPCCAWKCLNLVHLDLKTDIRAKLVNYAIFIYIFNPYNNYTCHNSMV